MISLYLPLKPISINQPFGQVSPIYTGQGMKGHNGIDFFAVHGQAIYASHDGTCQPTIDNHGGNGVILTHADGWDTIYWHMIQDNAVVETGEKVKAGALLGYADSTGISTGDHLHFGLALVGTDYNNGYHGYSDPMPYFNGKYAQEILTPLPTFQFTLTLKMGAWNNDVKQLQSVLKGQNLYSGVIDGIFGKITQNAVMAFQKAHNLTPDGIVGQFTRKVLNSLL